MIDNKELEVQINSYADTYANGFTNEPEEINSIMFQAFKAGATQQDKIAVDRTVDEVLGMLESFRKDKFADQSIINAMVKCIKSLR